MKLDETWVECIKMWRWVVKRVGKTEFNASQLKWQYIEEHFPGLALDCDCFFCEYAVRAENKSYKRYGVDKETCNYCPGKKVDKDFSCMNPKYRYSVRPNAFLKELLRLDRLRRKR